MANSHRGEIDAVIGGERQTLCLTLGALAELETRLQAGDLVGLAERFEVGRVSASDLIALIGAGLRGGGNEISDDELARLTVEGGLTGAAKIAAELLRATFGEAGT
ncbi:MAG: gene transfer agent family protein [Alphaproteobacteria bacterium]|nr:gene transfer agent family protein [Alphaproteobacteria bacterium]